MPLPPLPLLSESLEPEEIRLDIQGLYLYLSRLKEALDGFTPSQVAAALNLGGLGVGPGGSLEGVTVPVSPPVPDTPVMYPPVGFYKQIATSWDLDPNPYITGWEVQRADNLAFTVNVTTRTSALSLSFVDQDLADSTAYYYRIRALTADPANLSPFCAPQTATTLANDSTVLDQLELAVIFLQRAHIRDLVVDTAKINNASILTAKIGDLAVTTAKIALLAVGTAQINDLAVTTAKIVDLAVTNAKVNSLSADKLTAGTISVLVSLTNNTIKLDGVNSQITITDTQASPVVRARIGKLGAAASNYGFQAYNAAGALMWDSLASGAQSVGIEDLAIISQKLNDLAVLTGKVAANAITQSVTASVTSVYTNATASYTDVTDSTVTLTTTGGPVFVDFNGSFSIDGGTTSPTDFSGYVALLRDGTIIQEAYFGFTFVTSPGSLGLVVHGPATITCQETPSAAEHTYKVQAKLSTTHSGAVLAALTATPGSGLAKRNLYVTEFKK